MKTWRNRSRQALACEEVKTRPNAGAFGYFLRAHQFIFKSLLLLIIAFGLSACGSRETPVESANRSGILLYGNGTEPQNLDPHIVSGVPEINIIRSLLEGLVEYHPSDDNEVIPGVESIPRDTVQS